MDMEIPLLPKLFPDLDLTESGKEESTLKSTIRDRISAGAYFLMVFTMILIII